MRHNPAGDSDSATRDGTRRLAGESAEPDDFYNFRMIADASADLDTATPVHVSAGASLVRAAAAVEYVLAADAAVEGVLVLVGGQPAVLTSRALLAREFGLGTRRSPGDGDGASLPGESSGYVLLRYRCLTPACDAIAFGVYHDDRERPRCLDCGEPMDLVR